MRVLIHPRPIAPTRQGGDWLHLQAVLEPLRALGVQADISTDANASLQNYDLCLLWNSVEPFVMLPYFFNARHQNKRVALMPIYWSLPRLWNLEAELRGMNVSEPMREMERLRREIYLARERMLLRGADVLTPNSENEAARLENDFGIAPERLRVSHYGTSDVFANGNAERFRQAWNVHDFVLCVGQIGTRKNQLNLIRALREFPHSLVLLGDVENEKYAQLCRDAAKENRAPTHFIPRQTQNIVADAYAAARVHAILSIYEVGPLVALEAAVAGVPQVVTTECSMQNYLSAPTMFVDPEDRDAILRGVENIWDTPRAHELSKQLLQAFTWTRAANELKTSLEWMLAQPRVEYNPFPELLRAEELLEAQVECLWRVLGEQTANARQLEQWAHALESQLHAQRSFGSRLKALVTK